MALNIKKILGIVSRPTKLDRQSEHNVVRSISSSNSAKSSSTSSKNHSSFNRERLRKKEDENRTVKKKTKISAIKKLFIISK